jgi:hypothetical protein
VTREQGGSGMSSFGICLTGLSREQQMTVKLAALLIRSRQPVRPNGIQHGICNICLEEQRVTLSAEAQRENDPADFGYDPTFDFVVIEHDFPGVREKCRGSGQCPVALVNPHDPGQCLHFGPTDNSQDLPDQTEVVKEEVQEASLASIQGPMADAFRRASRRVGKRLDSI